jgi:hypothetical protein
LHTREPSSEMMFFLLLEWRFQRHEMMRSSVSLWDVRCGTE